METQWSLVLFTVLTGTAGWGLAALAVEELRGKVGKEGFFIGLVLLIVLAVGGCASVTHLSHPENMLAALTHPTSGIFVEAALMGVVGAASVVYLIVKKRQGSPVAVKALIVIAAVFGIGLSFMAGESYVVAARPAWNTVLMPLGYCLTVAPVGFALYVLAAATRSPLDDIRVLGACIGAAGVLGALSVLAWGISVGVAADIAPCIGISVAGQLIASLSGCLSRAKTGKNVLVLVVVALACSLVGAMAYRYGMWSVGYGIDNFFWTI